MIDATMDMIEIFKNTVLAHAEEFHPNKKFRFYYSQRKGSWIIHEDNDMAVCALLFCRKDLKGNKAYCFFVNPWFNRFMLLEKKLKLLGFKIYDGRQD